METEASRGHTLERRRRRHGRDGLDRLDPRARIDRCSYASRNNFLDLDPTYKDALGWPLIRMIYNDTDDAQKMSTYLLDVCRKIAEAIKPTHIQQRPRPKLFHVVPGQSTHNTGGTIMGSDPKTTVVNRYLQAWDATICL
jgi:gluconate 2-dehydrogenase alpha chain